MTKKKDKVHNEEEQIIDIKDGDAKAAENKEAEENQQTMMDEITKMINEFAEKDNKIEQLEKEKNELKDALLRRAAEFENYKRRTENEISAIMKYAAEGFIMKILPVYDDFSRTLLHIDEPNNVNAIAEGLKLIHNKFSKTLEDQQIKRIDEKGAEFDFNLHEALLQQPVPGMAGNLIVEVVEPGYIYKDKVIKHAKVIVSMDLPEENNAGNN